MARDTDPGVDRSEVNRALAKAIAYKHVGDDDKAEEWARELVRLLGCAGILTETDANDR